MKTGRKRIKNCILLLLLLAIPFYGPAGITVHAQNATVAYGSAEYVPVENEEFNIGLYIRCDVSDFVYTVTVQYDPSHMEYLGGADSAENGVLRFAGNGTGGERQYMLSFRALTEGECTVSVTEISVITDPSAGIIAEEGEMGAGMAEELAAQAEPPTVAEVSSLATAAVRIQPDVDCTLSGLSIEQLPDFALEPDVYEYDLTVSSETEELTLDAAPADERASVSISDTGLETGENTITVTVSGGNESRQYLLHVTRPEPESTASSMEETLEAAEETGTETAQTQEGAGAEEYAPAEEAAGNSGSDTGLTGSSEKGEALQEESVPVMAQPAQPLDSRGILSLPAIRYLLLGGGIFLLAAAGALAFFLWRRKRSERYFDDDDDEMEWMDLNQDEAWIRWLADAEEAEDEMAEEETGQAEPPKTAAEKLTAQNPEAKAPKAAEPAAADPAVQQEQPPVIRIEDVSMRFKINEINAGSLKEYLLATLKRQNKYHELEALQHITFDIQKGEVVGIIGTNGSGKSTLLKLIAGVLKPSEGNIEVDRKKVQLLTLGTGFDAELTARENVYLNGAIIGYSKEFIDENFDKIVEFAELEGFMDEKIKNFSSGMTSRLGFAIATVGETAEILILDEVLSVGDMFFRKKSEQRIKEMIHSGSTVLIVSHSTDTIIKNCTKAVWIEKGVLKEVGDPKKVCASYRKMAG